MELGKAIERNPNAQPPTGVGQQLQGAPFIAREIYPGHGQARPYDRYGVPTDILRDYTEAWTIIGDSPRAAAILARRCLQQILVARFDAKSGTLHKQLNGVQDKLDPDIFEALSTIKWAGNGAAHDPADVFDIDPAEAALRLRGIEYLIGDTYVADFKREEQLKQVTSLRESIGKQRSEEDS